MDHGTDLPSLGLEEAARSPADACLQREVRAWSLLPPLFALVLPWTWLCLAFAHDAPRIPPLLAAVLTSAALASAWYGRRRARRVLIWLGIGGYLLALALCVLLAKAL
ncbi:hypothetical protein [Streptomyces sp. NPDC101150]|uniref:hypothetical protein n=1 Tax=Streptomyces sp. NPDC101150 TaxID=3366114 RepID=UPI0038034FA0